MAMSFGLPRTQGLMPEIYRDVAAANVILNDTAGRAGISDACGDLTSTGRHKDLPASRVAEAGTICDSPQVH